MILCLCQGITDQTVRATIRQGARTLDDVVAACRAASDCGACQDAVLDLLGEIECRRAVAGAIA
jgi:bacterioferritin-associated ferredoxin